MRVLIKQWKIVYLTSRRALILSVCIIGILLAFNSYIAIVVGLEKFENGTYYVSCLTGSSDYFTQLMIAYGPVVILLIIF